MKIGIAACSNGQNREWKDQNDELMTVLESFGMEPVQASHIYAAVDEFGGTDEERAEDLMKFYKDSSIDAIYDISGGDLANGILRIVADQEPGIFRSRITKNEVQRIFKRR